MSPKKRGLGSGLDALLGVTQDIETSQREAASTRSQDLVNLPVERLQRGQYQPRRYFDEQALQELADSIREQGLLQPIVVRPIADDRYEIIAGERRWRACQIAGLDRIPAVVKDIDDEAAIAIALIENLQREDLNPMEEARALHRLKEEFGLTHEQVAKAVGKSRPAVSNALRLLSLSDAVQRMVENLDLEMGHARCLIGMSPDQQLHIAHQIVERSLSVRQAEALVRRQQEKVKAAGTSSSGAGGDADVIALERELGDKLGSEVRIQQGAGGRGKLVISYGSLDELDGILEHLRR
jgi:ParB family transcriptional regulator, chromosome partitioning protein